MAVKATKKSVTMKTKNAGSAKATQTARAPKSLTCLRGYEWKKVGRKGVALMRDNSPGVSVNCECESTGGCKITIDPTDPQTISCLESGCSSSCGWIIKVPGLVGRLSAKVARA